MVPIAYTMVRNQTKLQTHVLLLTEPLRNRELDTTLIIMRFWGHVPFQEGSVKCVRAYITVLLHLLTLFTSSWRTTFGVHVG